MIFKDLVVTRSSLCPSRLINLCLGAIIGFACGLEPSVIASLTFLEALYHPGGRKQGPGPRPIHNILA